MEHWAPAVSNKFPGGAAAPGLGPGWGTTAADIAMRLRRTPGDGRSSTLTGSEHRSGL